MKVTVRHGFYGCDTGCCGYRYVYEDGRAVFTFEHFDGKSPTEEEKAKVREDLGPGYEVTFEDDVCGEWY